MASNVEVKCRVVIDEVKLQNAVNNAQGMQSTLKSRVDAIVKQANALSSGFRTGRYFPNHKPPAVGNTQPSYKGDVKRGRKGPVGIVYTANYAAQKDNHLHNTLLKAKGR